MTDFAEDWASRLRQAVADGRRVEVSTLSHRLATVVREGVEPFDPISVVALLRVLQRKRFVGQVQELADALLTRSPGNVDVVHRYALALLDTGRTAAAEALLDTLPAEVRSEHLEVAGAVARVHKQRYLTSAPGTASSLDQDLRDAIEVYLKAYRKDPRSFYHGINAASLLARASRDGVAVPGLAQPATEAAAIARAILDVVAGPAPDQPWELATAVEASLVLGDHHGALDWMTHYVVAAGADAFEYASTLRQLELLWGLSSHDEPGRTLLPILRNRLLGTEGGSISVSPGDYTPSSVSHLEAVEDRVEQVEGLTRERVLGWARFQHVGWLREALEACRSVARVEDHYGNGQGTGFVLDGHAVGGDAWPRRVLLTNAHVVPEAVDVEEVRITFRGLADQGPESVAVVRPVGEPVWLSPPAEFDATFLALPEDLDGAVSALPLRRTFPRLDTGSQPRAYVIGHPLGSPDLQVSLHDTRLVRVDDVFAHYRSPTETGSSGSPVFDEHWKVMALHHGSTDALPSAIGPANEGIRIDRLLAAVHDSLRSKA